MVIIDNIGVIILYITLPFIKINVYTTYKKIPNKSNTAEYFTEICAEVIIYTFINTNAHKSCNIFLIPRSLLPRSLLINSSRIAVSSTVAAISQI